MVGQSGRNQGNDQQRRAIRDTYFQPSRTQSSVAEQTGTGCCPAAAAWFSETGSKSRSGRADTACARHHSAKSPTAATALATSHGGLAPVVVSELKRSELFAPVVVGRVRLTIRPGRKEIVFVRGLNSRAPININRAPGIFRKFLEELIPPTWSRFALSLGHERLQALLGGGIKTVHRFVLHQLRADCLDIGPDRGGFGERCGVAHF